VNTLHVALLGVLVLPIFVGNWRVSLVGLSAQGLLLAWIASRHDPSALDHASGWIGLVDFGAVRGVLAPLTMWRLLSARQVPGRNDVVAPNLFSWGLALGCVLLAFRLAAKLSPGASSHTLLAVSIAALLLGFLILSMQSSPLSQIIGLLRIENAVALFELHASAGAHEPIGLRLGVSLAFLVSVGFFRWYLARLVQPPTGMDAEEAVL